MTFKDSDPQPPPKGVRRLFTRSKDTPTNQPNNPLHVKGVVTDQKLIAQYYERQGIDTHPIATDRFLDKSRSEYNAAWLTRELVQNFVDHNQEHPATLDGVKFKEEATEDGKTRFTMEGNWPFPDPTGVLSPHSDKPEDRNTAGGNGIGLKQTAIRLLRDFGVSRFEIQGEGWTVNYRLAKAKDINAAPAGRPLDLLQQVKHDWLLADLKDKGAMGSNKYIIETGNPEIIAALREFPTLGVSGENPYLYNPDYQSEQGAIKWLPTADYEEPKMGRLFINGQVMNYQKKGNTSEDYWVGPQGVTIQLNNVRYNMNMDRPPVSTFELKRYIDGLVMGMSKDKIIAQLKCSETFWGGQTDTGYSIERPASFVLIERLVEELPKKKYSKEEYEKLFGGKPYLALGKGISSTQADELRSQGYLLCPSYMETLGMPTATSKLNLIDSVSNEAPKASSYERGKFAQEHGFEVAYEDFSGVKKDAFITTAAENLARFTSNVSYFDNKPNTVRVYLNQAIPKELLFRAQIPQKDKQALVYTLRGIAAYGLSHEMFEKVFTSQGNFITTFAVDYDFQSQDYALLTRNIEHTSSELPFIEIEMKGKHFQEFVSALEKASLTPEGTWTASDEQLYNVAIAKAPDALTVEEMRILERKAGLTRAFGEIEVKAWTTEQEQLFKAAIRKPPSELSDQERLIIQQRNQLQQEFGSVPVTQPEAPELDMKGNVVQKEATMSDVEKARVEQMETQLPGIIDVVSKLEELIPKPAIAELTGQSPIEKYLQWRQSEQFYGQLGDTAGYLTGRHLVELIEEQNQADISSVDITRETTPEDRILGALQRKLKDVVERMNPAEDDVNDFEIVLEPTEKQLAQLGLLRLYSQLTTGVALPNDLFVYKGTGSKGINFGQKAIGMHESLFGVNFSEAMRTFTHEIAHNYPEAEDHGNMFRHAMESLFTTTIDRVTDIARRLDSGQTATPEERVILDIQKEWHSLKQASYS